VIASIGDPEIVVAVRRHERGGVEMIVEAARGRKLAERDSRRDIAVDGQWRGEFHHLVT